MDATTGWLFLVARGRRHGYRMLLVPDRLLAGGEYGAVEEAVSPSGEPDQVQLIRVTISSRRGFTAAYTTHVVTAADLAGPPDGRPEPVPGPAAGPAAAPVPRDEHSRPLTLLYGYLCQDPWSPEPTQDDWQAAREQVLAVYRRFLDDEEGAVPVASRPRTIRAYASPVAASAPAPPEPARSDAVQPYAPPWKLAVIAFAVGIVVVFTILWLGRPDPPPPPREQCSSQPPTTGDAFPTPTPSCTPAGRRSSRGATPRSSR